MRTAGARKAGPDPRLPSPRRDAARETRPPSRRGKTEPPACPSAAGRPGGAPPDDGEAKPADAAGTALERAAVYRLLGELLAAEPDDELLRLAASLPQLAAHATAASAARYTHLFVLNVYPFASVYLERDAALGGERAGFTRGVLETLGLEVEAGIAADHAAVLFTALAALLEREAAADQPLEIERARHAQRSLLAEHLLPWIPHFLDAVERSDEGLYRAAAALAGHLVVAHARDRFAGGHGGRQGASAGGAGGRRREPGEGRVRPGAAGRTDGTEGTEGTGGPGGPEGPEDTHRTDGTDGAVGSDRDATAPLAGLTSPARCGFFLSRADITAIAADQGLAVRFGGRSFMLESLAQAAAQAGRGDELRTALRSFAAERRAVLERWSAALPTLAPLWQDSLSRIAETVSGWEAGRDTDTDSGTVDDGDSDNDSDTFRDTGNDADDDPENGTGADPRPGAP